MAQQERCRTKLVVDETQGSCLDCSFRQVHLQTNFSLLCLSVQRFQRGCGNLLRAIWFSERQQTFVQSFQPGDDLIFQLESGFGLLRVLVIDNLESGGRVWHLMAYEELFLEVELAEAALQNPSSLHTRLAHLALTDRAFERTPTARLGNRPVTKEELAAYLDWLARDDREVSDRSALLMLGLR
jgi:hypothetical protein